MTPLTVLRKKIVILDADGGAGASRIVTRTGMSAFETPVAITTRETHTESGVHCSCRISPADLVHTYSENPEMLRRFRTRRRRFRL